MSIPKVMALRMGVYCVLVGYLVCDLFVFKGPIYKTLNTAPRDETLIRAEASASGVAAKVYGRSIFRAQVEEAVKEYLWRRGRTLEETSGSERRMLRKLVVNQLIDEELMKLQITVLTAEEVAVPGEDVERAVAEEKKRYPDESVFEELAERAAWAGEEEREMRLAARLQRANYLRDRTEIAVTEEEARAWYDENREAFSADFEAAKVEIIDALELKKRDEMWKKFRYEKLRHYAKGKIQIFEDVLQSEMDGE